MQLLISFFLLRKSRILSAARAGDRAREPFFNAAGAENVTTFQLRDTFTANETFQADGALSGAGQRSVVGESVLLLHDEPVVVFLVVLVVLVTHDFVFVYQDPVIVAELKGVYFMFNPRNNCT